VKGRRKKKKGRCKAEREGLEVGWDWTDNPYLYLVTNLSTVGRKDYDLKRPLIIRKA